MISWKGTLDQLASDDVDGRKQAALLLAFIKGNAELLGNDEYWSAVKEKLTRASNDPQQALAQVQEIITETTRDITKALLAFIKGNSGMLGNDENSLKVEVALIQALNGSQQASARVREIIAETTRDNAPALLTLAKMANNPRLGLDAKLPGDCLEQYQKLRGMTPELATMQCQLQWDNMILALQKMQDPNSATLLAARKAAAAKGMADIKTLFQKDRSGVGNVVAAELEKWDINWCVLLEYFEDATAHDEWQKTISLHGDSSTALWAALSAKSVNADHKLSGQVLDQLKALNGDSGLKWRLAKGEWLLNDTSPSSHESLDQAAKLLAITVASSPDSVDAHKLLARGYELSGNLNNAINELSRATEMAPMDLEAKLTLANLYLRQRDSARAIDQLTRVLEKLPPAGPRQSPMEQDLRTKAGVMLADAGDPERARMILKSIPQGSNAVKQIIAAIDWKEGKIADAAADYKNLMAEAPTAEMIEQALPFFAATGMDAEAKDALAKLEATDATAAQKHVIKGSYLASTQQWDEAIKELEAGVKADPKNGNYWRRFIATLITCGRLADGVKAAADGAEALPGDSGRAAIARFSGSPDQLKDPDLQAYIVASVLSPRQAKGIDDALKILQAPGITAPDAAHKLERVADRNTESVSLQVLTIRKLMDANLLDEAIPVAQRAMLNDPDSAEPALLATQCLAQAERWDEALAAANKWKTLASGSPKADMVIASCYVNLNRAGDAVKLMQPYMAKIDVSDPKLHDVVMLYATALVCDGQAAVADTLVWPLASKNPTWHEDWVKLASDRMDKKDFSQAVKWIQRLADVIPASDINGQTILALGWFRLGKRVDNNDVKFKGIQLAQQVTGKPGEPVTGDVAARGVAAFYFGQLCEQNGDYLLAETYYSLALERNPTLSFAANNLAMLLVKENDKSKLPDAEKYAREALGAGSGRLENEDSVLRYAGPGVDQGRQVR